MKCVEHSSENTRQSRISTRGGAAVLEEGQCSVHEERDRDNITSGIIMSPYYYTFLISCLQIVLLEKVYKLEYFSFRE